VRFRVNPLAVLAAREHGSGFIVSVQVSDSERVGNLSMVRRGTASVRDFSLI
jgi:hypothetical protein